MNQDANKRRAAEAALDHIEDGSVIGVGTGRTVELFVEALARVRQRIEGAVASSQATEALLRRHNIPVVDLNSAGDLPLYIDGADEATRFLHLIKGGGGSLTREKIIAAASRLFVCIIDDSKLVDVLGRFPLPVEVIPLARSFVARQLVKLGGQPRWRQGFVTDNGNVILDVHHTKIPEPARLEGEIDQIPGVVCNGVFARRPADVLLVGSERGVETMR
ncbi:MAG: ribose-5-phosphate isomerase RpiA [Pseudomonadota bacterium]|nr:ribose-5-phosphate isomerase RpiA [Pseudomonadota bacterium]